MILQNVIKKRSLLTRGEESLARIASLAKQGDSASHVVNRRNFVFPHIDQNTDNISKKDDKIIGDLDSQIKVYNLITLLTIILFKLYYLNRIKYIAAIHMFLIFSDLHLFAFIGRNLYILTSAFFL